MPNNRPIKRDNHYVPSVYLKQWATNGLVPTYRLLVPHDRVHLWKHASLKGIAFYRSLYTYVAREGETDEFESWLDQTFEAPAEAVIARAIRGAPMSVDDSRRPRMFGRRDGSGNLWTARPDPCQS